MAKDVASDHPAAHPSKETGTFHGRNSLSWRAALIFYLLTEMDEREIPTSGTSTVDSMDFPEDAFSLEKYLLRIWGYNKIQHSNPRLIKMHLKKGGTFNVSQQVEKIMTMSLGKQKGKDLASRSQNPVASCASESSLTFSISLWPSSLARQEHNHWLSLLRRKK